VVDAYRRSGHIEPCAAGHSPSFGLCAQGTHGDAVHAGALVAGPAGSRTCCRKPRTSRPQTGRLDRLDLRADLFDDPDVLVTHCCGPREILDTDERAQHYFEIKTPKPNKGQCIEMKLRLLTALGIRRDENVFVAWAVPYNPYGTAETYSAPFTAQYFDFAPGGQVGGNSGISSATTTGRSTCF
jgi:Type II restriction endonuclease, TdeIII